MSDNRRTSAFEDEVRSVWIDGWTSGNRRTGAHGGCEFCRDVGPTEGADGPAECQVCGSLLYGVARDAWQAALGPELTSDGPDFDRYWARRIGDPGRYPNER